MLAFVGWLFLVILPATYFWDIWSTLPPNDKLYNSFLTGNGLERTPFFYGGYTARLVVNETVVPRFPLVLLFPTVYGDDGDLGKHHMGT